MVHGLPQLSTSSITCTDCIRGKQSRDPIPKQSTWRAPQKLELIHADICGPITPASNSNKRYILLFIDDYSRKAWVYFLMEKSEALVASEILNLWLRNKWDCLLNVFALTEGGNSFQTILITFAEIVESRGR